MTSVDKLIEEFVDSWVIHAFILPNAAIRQDFKTETIQKLEKLIEILEILDFETIALTEWDRLDTINEEKSND